MERVEPPRRAPDQGAMAASTAKAASGHLRLAWVLLSALCAILPSAAASVREEVVDDNYQTGYLTWAGSTQKGGLTWDPQAPTDDPAGPAEPTDPAEKAKQPLRGSVGLFNNFVSANARTVIGDNPFLPPPTDFVSEPLPRTLYVNASRLVRVDLYVTTCNGYSSNPPTDPQFSVELKVGEQWFTGAQQASPIYYATGLSGYAPFPKVPTGYCFRSFRMPAELDVLPAGSVITLRVVYESQQAWHRFGAAKDHRSILQIPFFPPEEAIFRFAELAPELGSGPSEEQAGASPLIAGVGMGLSLAGAAAIRPGRRQLAGVLLLLLASSWAGCLGGEPDSAGTEASPRLGGSAWSTIVKDQGNSTGLTNESSGSLAGVVHDDLGLPVGGAHVAVTATQHFADTDKAGRFTVERLPPGNFRLRVDHPSYRSLEVDFKIVAGSITRLDVTLERRDGAHGDFKPHRHDFWQNKDRVTIFEDTITTTSTTGTALSFTLPPPKIILPGAREVVVEITWPMSWLRRAALVFSSNIEKTGACCFINETIMYPREQGAPFRIAATKEMADPGHHQLTTWRSFVVRTALYDGNAAQRAAEPFRFTVKVTLVKGLVPFEAAHTNYWNGAESLVLLGNAARECCADGTTGMHGWRPKPMVPPETKWLEITHNQSKDTHQAFGLRARYANMRTTSAESSYKLLTPKVDEATYRIYHLPLKPEETDPFYAPMSNWFFIQVRMDNDEIPFSFNGCQASACYLDYAESVTGEAVHTVTVVAHRTEMAA